MKPFQTNLNRLAAGVALSWLALCPPLAAAQTNYTTLDHQHADFRVIYTPGPSNQLSLVAREGGAQINYASNEVVLNLNTNAKYILDGDFPPFGDAGDPIWIAPQSQEPSLLYLGVSAEGIPGGVFSGNLKVQLKAVDGPGEFFAWQADAFGNFNIRFNTRDGISTNDVITPIIGSHEHYNWGFTTSGVYYVTLQVSGRLVGETNDIVSPETTFVFHVLPLKPYEIWQEDHWLFVMPRSIAVPGSDPDGDGVKNVLEYAFGTDPNVFSRSNLPACVIVSLNGTNYGALRYCRASNASDLIFSPRGASAVANPIWSNLTDLFSNVTNAGVQTVIVRDSLPAAAAPHRYYQLRVTQP